MIRSNIMNSLSVLFFTVMLASGNVHAADGQALAQSKGCLSCHAVDSKLVGPAYKDVAKKYAGDKGAEDRLVQKVVKGGSGSWGAIPMPGGMATEAEARVLVKWVLGLK
jgi:cytochrome c